MGEDFPNFWYKSVPVSDLYQWIWTEMQEYVNAMSSTEVVSFGHYSPLINIPHLSNYIWDPSFRKPLVFSRERDWQWSCFHLHVTWVTWLQNSYPKGKLSYKKGSFEIKSACILNDIKNKLTSYFYCKLWRDGYLNILR